jgi:hypothetical protein
MMEAQPKSHTADPGGTGLWRDPLVRNGRGVMVESIRSGQIAMRLGLRLKELRSEAETVADDGPGRGSFEKPSDPLI